MGILNLNEDSFFAASRTKANEVAARAAAPPGSLKKGPMS